jgi:hypothetical protein
MRLLNILLPLLSAATAVYAATTGSGDQAGETEPPKHIVVARYHATGAFSGPGSVVYGIGRCINFAWWE